MTLHERIIAILESELETVGWSKHKLSKEAKIAYSTLLDFFKQGHGRIDLNLVFDMCKALDLEGWRVIRMAELNKVE